MRGRKNYALLFTTNFGGRGGGVRHDIFFLFLRMENGACALAHGSFYEGFSPMSKKPCAILSSRPAFLRRKRPVRRARTRIVVPRRVRTDDNAEDRYDVERRPHEQLHEGPALVEECLRLVQGFERRQDRRQVTDAFHHLLRRDTCELSRRRPALG